MGESTTHARFVISKPDVISSPTIDTKDVNLDILNGNKPKDNGQAYKKIEAPDQLALYAEDFQQKGKLQKLLQNVGSYSAVIPTSEKNNEIAVLGTLAGVYLPCIQNIFGVILFIRLSWIVGTAGVLEAFAIVLICCCCTMLTAISMSAIATNGKVPAGGSYFMISRSLGPEFGGAVGILFYLGTSFASAMYILGAVEIMLTYIIPEMTLFVDNEHSMLHNMRVYGSALVLLMGGLVFVGVKYVNKCASLFLACVLLSILAIFVGFFSIHARDSPSVCYLGERLLASTSYSGCSKNDTMLKSLYTGGSTEQSHFFNVSSVRSEVAVPGLSKIFLDQIFSHYLSTGEVRKGVAGFAGEVTADATVSFTILLAIFFPSVTGIMAGSNRSGNLRNAQASIPKGTIAAVITTSSVYLASVIFMGATINGDVLRDKFGKSIEGSLVVSTLAWPTKWAVLIGSLLSTIGAGLQSLTGAPRLLQAIAKDDIIPFLSVFAPVSRDGEPKRALLLTLLISEIGVLIASLDSVAPIITMFFLMCYGFINFACTLQSLLRLPNWRPRFHFYHWSLSLCGVLLCLFLMFISSWYYAIVACVIASFLYKYIEFRGAEKEWGDGFSGLALSAARYGLMRLENAPLHTKNWRPQILLLCSAESKENLLTEHSKKVISFSSQLKAGKGLTIVGSVIPGEFLDLVTERDELEEELNELMKTEKVKGFYTVACQPSIRDGFSQLIQTAGLGGLRPNTVMLGWPGNWKENSNWHSFINCVRTVSDQKHALMVVKNPHLFPDRTDREQGHIDIWWIVHDGGLMLLLAFLLIRHKVWKKCSIRIFAVAQLTDNSVQMKKNLEELVYNLRLKADIEVIEMEDCDISAYTYERTLKAEQRKEMVARMRLSRRQSKREAQVILDSSHIPTSQDRLHQENLEPPVMSPRTDQQPEESNVRRMNTSLKLNSLITQRSNQSKLVLINLPMPPHALSKQIVYMEFVEALTEGIGRVLLIRGSGEEVVTIYS